MTRQGLGSTVSFQVRSRGRLRGVPPVGHVVPWRKTMSRGRILFIAAGAAGLLMLTFTVAWAAGTLSPKEQLGKAIFFDQNLSLNRNLSCASCHGAAVGF